MNKIRGAAINDPSKLRSIPLLEDAYSTHTFHTPVHENDSDLTLTLTPQQPLYKCKSQNGT